jgi:hypothetical protein
MSYSEKLKDPRWQKKRLEVFNRDKFACLCCGRKDQTLHVHHLRYAAEPWDTPMDHLETLCEQCHEMRTAFDEFWRNHLTKDKCVVSTFLVMGSLCRLDRLSKTEASQTVEEWKTD